MKWRNLISVHKTRFLDFGGLAAYARNDNIMTFSTEQLMVNNPADFCGLKGKGMFRAGYIWVIGIICIITAGCLSDSAFKNRQFSDGLSWPGIKTEHRAGTYWHWMGSAVDEPNLTWNLEDLKRAGIGSVTIVPVYGVKGRDSQFIEYLSDNWLDMLAFTVKEAKRLDMNVDMTTGTGWPFGGPHISGDNAAKLYEFKKYDLTVGEQVTEKITKGRLQTVMAYNDNDKIVDLTDRLGDDGTLDWTAPDGRWKVYAASAVGSGMQVKRAAPGGEGNIVDPFSVKSLKKYLEPFNAAFAKYKGPLPRAQYHDSFEYWATWTSDIFDEFRKRRGYDLRLHLPALYGDGDEDTVERIRSDCSRTFSELLYDYIDYWVKWSHDKGFITRNQAHGSTGNLLDLYALADIAECEIFGATDFKIPGFRRNPKETEPQQASLAVLKFASSAAHTAGRNLVAAETCTWLREHFKVSLSHCKPEIDRLFVSGVNHIFYHSIQYSPADAAWPGWLFYASSHFGATNSFRRDFPALNSYVARCQSILQAGTPSNDILLYWPIYDYWHSKDALVERLTIHHIHSDKWFKGTSVQKIADKMLDTGFSFDYISDRQINELKVSKGQLQTAGLKYKTIVVPTCRRLPLETLKKLMSLARDGATVIISRKLPEDVAGFGNLRNNRYAFRRTLGRLDFTRTQYAGISEAKQGNGRVLLGDNLEKMLALASVQRERIADRGISFIRRSHSYGYYYFLANLGDKKIDEWMPIAVKAKSVVIMDPLSTGTGVGAVRQTGNSHTEVYLQLEPGQSVILRTFTNKKVKGPRWRYIESTGKPLPVKGIWQVEFIQGGPKLPASFATETLQSWTNHSNLEAKRFAGTARYTITFDMPAEKTDDYILELGDVRDSAKVYLNGRFIGTLFSIPFKIPVGNFLHKGKNILQIEVTNLSANRIADMDRRGVKWKKFYNINFVNINYQPFDASTWKTVDCGLLGPVRLVAVMLKKL